MSAIAGIFHRKSVHLRSCSLPPWSRLTPPDDEAKYRSARLAAGRGRPALPRRHYARQSIVVLKRYTVGRTGRPPLPCSIESKYRHRRLAYDGSPSGGRGAPLPCSIESKHGHRRLAYDGSPSGGRGAPLPCSIESKHGHRRLARRGSLSSPTCPRRLADRHRY